MKTIHEALREACHHAGLVYKEVPADGKWYRVDCSDEPAGKGSGEIRLFLDGEGGMVRNFKTDDEAQPFFVGDYRDLPENERRERTRRREEAVKAARAEDRKRRAEAAAQAAGIWAGAAPAGADHPYLKKKNVKPYGIRVADGLLIVPVLIDGVISSIQYISGEGEKKHLRGGQKSGGYFLIGEATAEGVICISEGYATGATIHEATGYPVAVAFDAGNLRSVAGSIHRAYPTATLIVCGDDDHATAGNPGRTKAIAAAKDAGAGAVFPSFGADRAAQATDFNDMAAVKGMAAVREAIEEAAKGALPDDEIQTTISRGIKDGKAKPRGVPESKTEPDGADALEWKEPKPIKGELAPVPAFDPETLLPAALRDWIMDEADRMPCPPDYIAAAVIVELGAAIGARCAMKPKANDDWSVVPNLWGGVVAPPSAKKTPAINAAMKPLDRLAARAREEFDAAMKEYQGQDMKHRAVKEAFEAQIKTAAKKSVKPRDDGKTGEDDDLDKYIQGYQDALEPQGPKPPAMRRYKVNDGTIEKIGEILQDNPAGLLVLRDELVGLLASWERSGHEEDRAFYLEAWNGMNSHDVDRIGRGSIRVPNLCLSLFGGIQPDKLIGYLEEATNALANDGMLQRFQILVYPDPRSWEWRDRRPRHDARERVCEMFDTLAYFTPEDWGATPADEHVKVPCFRFSLEAQTVFIEWSRELNRERIPAESSVLIQQHIGKYEKLFAALSLIFHLVDCVTAGARGPVSRDCALRAAAWCEYLEAHARRCYGLLQDGGLRAAQALSEKIQAGELEEGFTARDVIRNQWRYLTNDEAVGAALDWLEDEGWIRGLSTGGTGPGSGRKTLRYIVNPKARREGRNV